MTVTTSVMHQVPTLARMDGMPRGLKIKNKTGLVSYDASKTAGVDYAQDTEEHDNEYDKSETESETESYDDDSESSESSINE